MSVDLFGAESLGFFSGQPLPSVLQSLYLFFLLPLESDGDFVFQAVLYGPSSSPVKGPPLSPPQTFFTTMRTPFPLRPWHKTDHSALGIGACNQFVVPPLYGVFWRLDHPFLSHNAFCLSTGTFSPLSLFIFSISRETVFFQ